MNGSREIWAIIPARGGSKGLPRKNIIPLRGIPLIAWSIAAAKSAKNVDRVIVSTDDVEIAGIAESYGAEVPFLRPPGLAGDTSLIGAAIDYTVDEIVRRANYAPLAICVLYPTHPFRSAALVDETASGLRSYLFVGTVAEFPVPMSAFVTLHNKQCVPIVASGTDRPLYFPSGVAYGYRYFPPGRRLMDNVEEHVRTINDLLAKGEIASLRKKIVFVPDPRMEIDIDTAEDLELAERLVRAEDVERIRAYERGRCVASGA